MRTEGDRVRVSRCRRRRVRRRRSAKRSRANGLEAVVICPSNPFISIDPILAVPGMRAALAACRAPVVAVSPIIGGRAVKGPTAKMMAELGMPTSARAVAEHYGGLLDGFVLDEADADDAAAIDVPCLATRTLMASEDDKRALAAEVLAFARGLGGKMRARDGYCVSGRISSAKCCMLASDCSSVPRCRLSTRSRDAELAERGDVLGDLGGTAAHQVTLAVLELGWSSSRRTSRRRTRARCSWDHGCSAPPPDGAFRRRP